MTRCTYGKESGQEELDMIKSYLRLSPETTCTGCGISVAELVFNEGWSFENIESEGIFDSALFWYHNEDCANGDDYYV